MKLLLLDRPIDEGLPRQRRVEFFGPWAQPIRSPQDLSGPAFEPYPDPQSVYSASLKTINAAEDILAGLSDILPALTGVRKGTRFWKAYLGFHVVMLAGLVEDMKNRHRALPDKDYILGLPSNEYTQGYIPYTWKDAWKYLQFDDSFKWLAMSVYLKDYYRNQELIEYQEIPLRRICKRGEELRTKLLQNGPCWILKKVSSSVLGRFVSSKRINFYKMRVGSLVWDRYQMEDYNFERLGAFLLPEKYPRDNKPLPIFFADTEKRGKLKDALPHPYGELLSRSLPLIDLEGLAHLIKVVEGSDLSMFGGVKSVYTHGQAFSDDGMRRVLFALLADTDRKIMAVQHGIGDAYLAHAGLFTERTIADGHIYWGPGYYNEDDIPGREKAKALPSIYLSGLTQKARRAHKKKKWDILFVVLEENRYIKWLYSPLFPDAACDYFRREKVYFDYFCSGKNTAIKAYPFTCGWGQFDWIKRSYPRARLLTAGKFVNYALKSKIVIVDYLGTSFLEILAMKMPFLATWNRRWFKGSSCFEGFIDHLTEAGIFYEQPQDLIGAYRDIIGRDVHGWWIDKKRQSAIKAMADNFAMVSEMAEEEWEKEFAGSPGKDLA